MFSITCSRCGKPIETESLEGTCENCHTHFKITWPASSSESSVPKTISSKYEEER